MHMWCPDGIGRDSWDRVLAGFGRLASLLLPPERGKKPSLSESSVSVRESDCPSVRLLLLLLLLLVVPLPKIYRAFGEEFDCWLWKAITRATDHRCSCWEVQKTNLGDLYHGTTKTWIWAPLFLTIWKKTPAAAKKSRSAVKRGHIGQNRSRIPRGIRLLTLKGHNSCHRPLILMLRLAENKNDAIFNMEPSKRESGHLFV